MLLVQLLIFGDRQHDLRGTLAPTISGCCERFSSAPNVACCSCREGTDSVTSSVCSGCSLHDDLRAPISRLKLGDSINFLQRHRGIGLIPYPWAVMRLIHT